ncbi:uncharacterized protein LOC130905806 [Corythoichthys intestinalis]|uniref:uncharacterized protein LOC130905806 n=1 Tax=Corythoichthys intestinalis TaxID=161448 RepID=UPI0025A5FF6B|nr:uncharacterized protein LOC130905806 [Corythoichthys intestinalis]
MAPPVLSLILVLLVAASARPVEETGHQDADITETSQQQGSLDWDVLLPPESDSAQSHKSSESRDISESESSEKSFRVLSKEELIDDSEESSEESSEETPSKPSELLFDESSEESLEESSDEFSQESLEESSEESSQESSEESSLESSEESSQESSDESSQESSEEVPFTDPTMTTTEGRNTPTPKPATPGPNERGTTTPAGDVSHEVSTESERRGDN